MSGVPWDGRWLPAGPSADRFPVENAPFPPTAAERAYRTISPYPWGLAWLTARALGATRHDLAHRTGQLPDAAAPLVWFHGASAGEMGAAIQLAALLHRDGVQFIPGFTATNRAGVEFVSRRLGSGAVAALAPWDTPRWVARAFDRWRPLALLLVETELWPALIFEAHRRGVPVFCVSARIYPQNLLGYRCIRRLMAPTLRRLTGILTQNPTERARFIELGAVPGRCLTAGNLKHVGAAPPTGDVAAFREELGLGSHEPVVACGSVHVDEVGFLFAALERLRLPAVRLILAPRHPTATASIVKAALHRGWKVSRRSHGATDGWHVLVLDSMGELHRVYALAQVAVVGGGFGRHGGHNPLEPIANGAPALFGEHFEHFEEEAAALATATPEARVCTPTELAQRLRDWLSDGARRRQLLARQRQTLPDGAAIARTYVAALSPWLGGRAP